MSYRSRLKEAFNLRRPELYVRVGVGTALATAAFNLFMPDADSPVSIQQEPTPEQVTTSHLPDETTYIPAKLAPVIERGPSVQIEVTQAYSPDFNASPLTEVATQQITAYTAELRAITREDPSAYVTVRVAGMASDESRADGLQGDANLGRASEHNTALARQRAQLAETALRMEVASDSRISIDEVSGVETVLSREDIMQVDRIAHVAGLTRQELLAQYNDGDLALSEDDMRSMRQLFDTRRGARIEATVLRDVTPILGPCDEVVTEIAVPGRTLETTQPGDAGWRVDIVPGFLPPLSGRRRKEDAVETASRSLPEDDSRSVMPTTGVGAASGQPPRGRHRPEYIHRQQHGADEHVSPRQKNRFIRRTLGVVAAAAAVFPWPSWESQQADATPPIAEECLEVSTEPGWKREVAVSFPVIDAIDRVTGDRLDATNVHLLTDIQPDETTLWQPGHMKYEVDENGRIITQTYIPERSEVRHSAPRFTE